MTESVIERVGGLRRRQGDPARCAESHGDTIQPLGLKFGLIPLKVPNKIALFNLFPVGEKQRGPQHHDV